MTRIYSRGGQPLDYSSDSSNFRLRLEKLSYDGFVVVSKFSELQWSTMLVQDYLNTKGKL